MSSPAAKERLTAYQRWELDSFDAPRRSSLNPASLNPASLNPASRSPASRSPASLNALPGADEVKRIRDQAREQGFATGYNEGAQAAAAQLARLTQLVGSLGEQLQEYEQHVAGELLELALAVAGQMLRQALKARPELLLPVVQEALAELPHSAQRTELLVNPADAALVRERLGERLSHAGVQLVEDPQIRAGGCRIATPECDIDATVERRWQRIVATLGVEHAWIA